MRDARDILKLILDIAKQDERIVSVLLNGSRANPYSGNDRLQDYDIIFATEYVNEFVKDKEWHKQFGPILDPLSNRTDEHTIEVK